MAGSKRSTGPEASEPKARGRPVDQDSQLTRATILAAAQRLFGEAGYQGVSMERLASESGLTVRALYHYFPSKRALFKAATDEAMALAALHDDGTFPPDARCARATQ